MLWNISFQIWQFWISIRRICQSQTLAASRNHLRSTSIMVGMALWGEDTGSCKGKPRSESRVGRRVGWHLLTLMKLIRGTSNIESTWRWPNGLENDQGRLMFEGFTARCRKTILRRWTGPSRCKCGVSMCIFRTTHGKPSPSSNLGSRVI